MKPTVSKLVLRFIAASAIVVCLGLASPLRADDSDAGGASGRAVRLSSVDGQVQIAQGPQALADHAVPNTPLFEGTQITTATDGRAELQFDDGSVVRIPPESSLTLSILRANGETEVVLNGGMGYFELQGGGQDGPIRVRFGSSAITASGFTVIRVNLDGGPASVAVFSGNAHLEDAGLVVDLHGGESVAINGGNPSDSTVAESIEPDSWDAWNSDRDQALTASEAASAPPDQALPQNNNPAWSDLNSNGAWYNVPDQGYIWSPYEASNPGWDPYGTGNWMWTPRFGYVWVSGEPWGYMPYQCGAWNYYDSFGWGWAPGMCQTWWGGGNYGGENGWNYTIGNTPKWYRLPVRPVPPRPRSPLPIQGVRAVGPEPFIPVNRRFPQAGGAPLPPREVGRPVTIHGTVTAPLRPDPTRPVYRHENPPSMGTIRGIPSHDAPRPVYPRASEPPAQRGNWPSSRPPSQQPSRPPSQQQQPPPSPSQPPPRQWEPRPTPPPSAPRPSEGNRPSYGGGRSAPPPPPPSRSSPPPSAPSHSEPPSHPK